MSDKPNHLLHLPPSRTPRGPFAWLSALDPAVKSVLGLFAAVGAIAGAVQLYNALVTEGELQAFRSADAKAIEAIERDTDLLFQTQMRLTTDNDWLKQELSGVRQDLRRMDRGLPLPPLTPAPAAHPTPTRTP